MLDRIASIAEDDAGELYILEHGGNEIYRIVRRCGATRVCETSPNSVGSGALAGWSGSVSLAANDLRLDVSRAPANTLGLFFYAPGIGAPMPVGNGSLCLDGGGVGYFRLPVMQAGFLGTMEHAVDFSAPPMASGPGQVQAGSTWCFQAWYRDVGGPGGTGFNLTDALSILFCP